MASQIKAHVIVGALPFISHLTPMRTIAQHLVALGYQVTVIVGGALRHSVEDIGATCFVPAALKDFEESSLAAKVPTYLGLIGPVPGVNFMASRFFTNAIPIEFDVVQEVLASSQAENPSKPVILLPESSLLAFLSILLGALGLRLKMCDQCREYTNSYY
jgi:hypothetical protein